MTIKSVTKGWGERSEHYEVNDQALHAPFGNSIKEIREETNTIGKGYYNDLTIKTYCGYDTFGNKLFELEQNSSLTVIYDRWNQ